MTASEDDEQIARRLARTYSLRVPEDVIASALTARPKLPILLSRTSFRADVDMRTNQRTHVRRERRNFLRAGLALMVLAASGWILWSLESTPPYTPAAQSVTVQTPVGIAGNPFPLSTQPSPSSSGTQLITNAASLPPGQSLTYNDPTLGPILLIHLDTGQFVAYSAICTHAGCQVQFDPSLKDIVCPCHGAVYDPYHNAQVLGGPAPYPLQSIPIQYNQSNGNIYLTG